MRDYDNLLFIFLFFFVHFCFIFLIIFLVVWNIMTYSKYWRSFSFTFSIKTYTSILVIFFVGSLAKRMWEWYCDFCINSFQEFFDTIGEVFLESQTDWDSRSDLEKMTSGSGPGRTDRLRQLAQNSLRKARCCSAWFRSREELKTSAVRTCKLYTPSC